MTTGPTPENAGGSALHARRIAEALERLGRLIRAREYDGDLNPAQWEALRFIARANRHSNAPSVLAQWLGATKGTVSQTVTALERKGLVEKRARPGPGRGVALSLTEQGRNKLQGDPLKRISQTAESLGVAVIPLARHLERLIDEVRLDEGAQRFGSCRGCRWLKPRGDNATMSCQRFDSPLEDSDMDKLCADFAPPG